MISNSKLERKPVGFKGSRKETERRRGGKKLEKQIKLLKKVHLTYYRNGWHGRNGREL